MRLRLACDPNDAPELIRPSVTVATAAARLETDESTIRKLIAGGSLEGHRMGKSGVRIYVDSITAYQEGRPLGAKNGKKQQARPRRKPAQSAVLRESVAHLASLGIVWRR